MTIGTAFHCYFSLGNVDPHDHYDALWFSLRIIAGFSYFPFKRPDALVNVILFS